MKTRILTIVMMTLLILTGCGKRHKTHGSLLTPQSSGNPYEVMVVADDSVYQGYAGLALQKDILDKSLLGLPQAEEQFHKSHINPDQFDHITNIFRNIIRINIGHEFTMAKMRVEKDVYSTPQVIVTVNAPDQVEASVFFTEHAKQIASIITSEEINREAEDLADVHNIKFAEAVKKKFGCVMYIPTSLKEMKEGKDFIWASDNGLRTIQNIVIYSYPYVSEKMFMRGPYIALRDTIMKKNIPGGHPGQWMQTNKEFVWTENLNVRGAFCMEARGLWEMKGDAMGGPFVSHSVIDSVNNRVITVEGFIYAPDKMKRTMVRRMEAALYTLETPDGTTKAKATDKKADGKTKQENKK